ncbi:MAG: biotin/lipoyl-containing protein [Thermoanaerobaculia bacterium]
MNEIEAEVEGAITRIYPQNGQPIEYGEKLFAVRLS